MSVSIVFQHFCADRINDQMGDCMHSLSLEPLYSKTDSLFSFGYIIIIIGLLLIIVNFGCCQETKENLCNHQQDDIIGTKTGISITVNIPYMELLYQIRNCSGGKQDLHSKYGIICQIRN